MLDNLTMPNGLRTHVYDARRFIMSAIFVAFSLVAFSCSNEAKPEQRHDLKGTVVGVDRARGKVDIAHEEIPGYMAAMTMPFTVKDPDVLNSMSQGDQVQATLVVTDDGYRLESPVISKAIPGVSSGVAGGIEPKPGDEVPPVKLVNQFGRPLNLGPADPRATVVTFIYTRCPFADQCPLMSINFAALNEAIAKDEKLKKSSRLLSVTLDPGFDTPEVLRDYAATYTGGTGDEKFARWDFATGDPGEIRRLATFLGLMYKEDDGQLIHSLRTAVLTPDGKLHKLYRGNEWKTDDILHDLNQLSAPETMR